MLVVVVVEVELSPEACREEFEGTRLEPSGTGLTCPDKTALLVALGGRIFDGVLRLRLCASAALSTSVFLFIGGSGTVLSVREGATSSLPLILLQLVTLCLRVEGGGMIARALLSEVVISDRPSVAGMRLGGRRPDPRIILAYSVSEACGMRGQCDRAARTAFSSL